MCDYLEIMKQIEKSINKYKNKVEFNLDCDDLQLAISCLSKPYSRIAKGRSLQQNLKMIIPQYFYYRMWEEE